jgi:hypothetical protein
LHSSGDKSAAPKEMENEKKQISLDLKPEIAKGSYSNLAIITHSRSEFIIDFATMLPGLPKPEIGSRLIMTPEHAKRLLMALQDNIIKYEKIIVLTVAKNFRV